MEAGEQIFAHMADGEYIEAEALAQMLDTGHALIARGYLQSRMLEVRDRETWTVFDPILGWMDDGFALIVLREGEDEVIEAMLFGQTGHVDWKEALPVVAERWQGYGDSVKSLVLIEMAMSGLPTCMERVNIRALVHLLRASLESDERVLRANAVTALFLYFEHEKLAEVGEMAAGKAARTGDEKVLTRLIEILRQHDNEIVSSFRVRCFDDVHREGANEGGRPDYSF
jgi:hypothetical protein